MTVIANDLVPIVPYETDSVILGIGQRYDVIINATQSSGDYWMRAIWQTACIGNTAGDDNNILAIVRYDASSTADPTSTSDAINIASACEDEPYASLVPYLSLNVDSDYTLEDDLALSFEGGGNTVFTWTINTSSLFLNWSDPSILRISDGETIWPTDYNVVPVTGVNEWVVYVIENDPIIPLNHPIHLHGHDFWVLAQEADATFDASTFSPTLKNAPRRDVATLPSLGYLAIAFLTDNPGSWLMHCHIAWHASQGLALQFVERESEIIGAVTEPDVFADTCSIWQDYYPTEEFVQDDSGI